MKEHPCGTHQSYRYNGCRCDPCRAAAVRDVTLWRMRTRASGSGHNPALPDLIDAAPIREHLAALTASGLSLAEIARDIGGTREGLRAIRNGTTRRTHRRTAAAVLAVAPLPDPRTVVDEVAVRRVIDEHADVSTLNAAEKREAIRQAQAAGRSWTWVQRVLRVSGTTVARARQEAS